MNSEVVPAWDAAAKVDVVAAIRRMKEIVGGRSVFRREPAVVWVSAAKAEWLAANPEKAVPLLRGMGYSLPDDATAEDIWRCFGVENGAGLTVEVT